MNKILSIVLLTLLSLTSFGCTAPDKKVPPTPPQQQPPAQQQEQPAQPGQAKFRPSLGGIKLGDSKDQLLQAFGPKYAEEIFEDAYTLGEPFARLIFPNGIIAIVGTKTNKVLELETSSSGTATNLGYKVGDKAEEVLAKYRTFYQEPNSRHQDSKLMGWFLLPEEELIIFNFAKGEELVNNPQLKPDARIERIKLSNFKYMD